MARLIDADALPVSKEYCVDEAGFGASFYVVHKSYIDKAPAVDAVEVVHGEWNMGESGVVYFCSRCRCAAHPRESERWHYCPNCGAKMDGERKESE